MNRHLLVFVLALPRLAAQEAQLAPVTFQIDLTALSSDRLSVACLPPPQSRDSLRFFLPKIVPGIYGAMDFGQYVEGLEAFDARGAALPVSRLDTNTWLIAGARRLATIRYTVNDTWDHFGQVNRNSFYRSAGSMYRHDSVFVINHNTLLGYLEGQTDRPHRLEIVKPAGFFGAGALRPESTGHLDRFSAPGYRALVDAPLLYARPDTAHLRVANADVLVAVYSETPGRHAARLATGLRRLLESQKDYLGGRLPVDRYAFLIYHTPSPRPNDYIFDALEHAQSSLYLLSTDNLDAASGIVRDIAAHEFFHIVTPLNIHSEEIEQYDFNAPKLSRHLWLYEGMTEYATLHMPVKQGLASLEEFFGKVEEKIKMSGNFRTDLALTDLSLHAMDLQDQYYNVYLRGALVGLCLDILLREGSAGRYGTQDLMRDLALRYGPDRPFRDAELFDVIAELTRPQVRDFFRRHVEGAEPLPLEEAFGKAGIRLKNGRLTVMEEATEEQVKLRRSWIGR
jgi:predicted metalloprotease with PDZ domain